MTLQAKSSQTRAVMLVRYETFPFHTSTHLLGSSKTHVETLSIPRTSTNTRRLPQPPTQTHFCRPFTVPRVARVHRWEMLVANRMVYPLCCVAYFKDPYAAITQQLQAILAAQQQPPQNQLQQQPPPQNQLLASLLAQLQSNTFAAPPNPYNAPTAFQLPPPPAASADQRFLRGVVDLDKLPQWQRDELLNKQQQQFDQQQELQHQIDAKQRDKFSKQQQQQQAELGIQQRLERERHELEDQYQREKANEAAIKTGAASNNGVDLPTSTQMRSTISTNQHKPTDASPFSGKPQSDEERRNELYLKAKEEAEELKRNKFKAIREAHRRISTDSVAVVDVERSESPPLPAAIRNAQKQHPVSSSTDVSLDYDAPPSHNDPRTHHAPVHSHRNEHANKNRNLSPQLQHQRTSVQPQTQRKVLDQLSALQQVLSTHSHLIFLRVYKWKNTTSSSNSTTLRPCSLHQLFHPIRTLINLVRRSCRFQPRMAHDWQIHTARPIPTILMRLPRQ